MSNENWRKGRRCTIKNHIQLVFLTKHKHALTEPQLNRLKEIFDKNCTQIKCQLISFEGSSGHVHLCVSVNQNVSIANLVGVLKGKSSYFLIREFQEELKNKIIENHLWASSYCAVSSSEENPLEIVKAFLLTHE